MSVAGAANRLWTALNAPRYRRFRAALRDPAAAQARVLRECVERNAQSVFGRRHGFELIGSADDFQRRVPIGHYDDHAELIARVRRGEPRVLTAEPALRLVPSSGATGAAKLLPWTRTLQEQFNRAIGAWIVNLYGARPSLRDGPAYWSISPALRFEDGQPSAVPIGFDDDTDYLGGCLKRLVNAAIAVPAAVRHVSDVESFRYVTLLHLLRSHDLRLISVWHPSFLTLLLDALGRHWGRLLDDVRAGSLTPPHALDPAVSRALKARLTPRRRRADELIRADPRDPQSIWPRLPLISCWGDGHAAGALAGLLARWPGAEIQPKGLVATEAFVTVPIRSHRPVALTSHFFEFVDDSRRPWLAHQLRQDGEYSVVVTTGGGLYRYRLMDRVRVEGFLGRAPSLRFIGKEDGISDRCGEKLSDAFVARVLREVLDAAGVEAVFSMLAPDVHTNGVGYTLYLETPRQVPSQLPSLLQRALCANPHYAYCVALGQLAPARVYRVSGGAHEAFIEHRLQRGAALGDVKPALLDSMSGWSQRFQGTYVGGAGAGGK